MSQKIFYKEDYKVFDKLKSNKKAGPIGWVRAFNGGKLIHDGPNLIVAKGREFVAQKLFMLNNAASSTRPNFYNSKISHFGVGSGGAVVDNNTVSLQGPAIGDTGMYQPITLGDESYLDDPSNFTASDQTPLINSYENSVKPILNHNGGVELEPISYEGTTDWYTQVKCTCIIPEGEPSVLGSGQSVQISEAGLYFVNESLADTDPNKVNMFAHICFSPKWNEIESELIIYWYILC